MTSAQWNGTYDDVPLGIEETNSLTVDGAAIDAFAHAIQSFNPIHMDGDWARANTQFPDRIAHGVMTTALMSNPIVQFCERYQIRTALLSTSSKYLRPVVAGDTITTTIRLVEKIDARKRMRFEVEARNQDGELVMVGEAMEQAI
ncbi:MAG: MaoC family dehydratase [Pseudomonadota bacterium]